MSRFSAEASLSPPVGVGFSVNQSSASVVSHIQTFFIATRMIKSICFPIIILCSTIPISHSNVCLHDKRVIDTSFHEPDHHFNVPGDYYDSVIIGIFNEMKRSGNDVFIPVNNAGDPGESLEVEGDHEYEAGEEEGEHSLSYLALIMMFSLVVIIIQARLLPAFPTPISTLFTGILFAVIYKQTRPFGVRSDHLVNIVS